MYVPTSTLPKKKFWFIQDTHNSLLFILFILKRPTHRTIWCLPWARWSLILSPKSHRWRPLLPRFGKCLRWLRMKSCPKRKKASWRAIRSLELPFWMTSWNASIAIRMRKPSVPCFMEKSMSFMNGPNKRLLVSEDPEPNRPSFCRPTNPVACAFLRLSGRDFKQSTIYFPIPSPPNKGEYIHVFMCMYMEMEMRLLSISRSSTFTFSF